MQETGIEPVWSCLRGILSPLRLPIPPLLLNRLNYTIYSLLFSIAHYRHCCQCRIYSLLFSIAHYRHCCQCRVYSLLFSIAILSEAPPREMNLPTNGIRPVDAFLRAVSASLIAACHAGANPGLDTIKRSTAIW